MSTATQRDAWLWNLFSRAIVLYLGEIYTALCTLQQFPVRHTDTHCAVGAHVHNHEEADTQLGVLGAGEAAHEQASSH